MSVAAAAGVMFAGSVVAMMFFLVLTRWAALVHGAYQQCRALEPTHVVSRTVVLTLCQSLFHEAPWAALTLAFIAYQVRSEPWAPWLLAGFAGGAAYMGMMVAVAVRRFRRPR